MLLSTPSIFVSWTLLLFTKCILSAPAPVAAPAPAPAPISSPTRDIYQYPAGTWAENLAVRANGQLIITRLDQPIIQLVNPFTPGKAPVTIYTFPAAAGCTGITEYAPDIFAVVTGNFSLATRANPPGEWSVWKVDMRSYTGPGTAKVTKITDVPTALLLNGATLLDPIKGSILIADSLAANLIRVDASKGTYTVVQADTTMAGVNKGGIPIGINGVRVRDGKLYFTNGTKNIFVRVSINPADGTATGAYTILVTNTVGAFDDFAADIFGEFFNCQGPAGTLAKITVQGNVGTEQEVAGNASSKAITGNTSARFGRTVFDLTTLYVTTNGGFPTPVEGAKIVAVDVPIL